MLSKFKKMLVYIAIVSILIFCIIFYISGSLQASLYNYGSPNSLASIFACIGEHGWPASFWIFSFIAIGGFAYIYARFFSRLKRQDKIGRKFFTPKGTQSYGEAHFAEPEEYKDMARIVPIKYAQGVILGQLTDDGSQCISLRTDYNRANRNIAIIGGSGSGKSYTFTNNFAYQFARRRESVVFTDPDGGLYRDLHSFFENRGYVVKCFNLKDFDKSNFWNCLGSLSVGDLEQNVSVFADTIVHNASEDAEEIYINGQKQLLKALLLRVFLGTDFAEEEKNIRTVYDLLMHENLRDFLSNLFSESSDQPYQRTYMKPWRASCNGSQNLVGNIMTNLSTTLEVFQSDKLCDLLSYDDIDLSLPGDRPCAYFCVFPDSHDTYRFICSLFFAMFFQTLIAKADSAPNGKLDVPVNFVLDEFANIGKLPDWDKKMSTIRKRNITAIMILQDLSQIEAIYGDVLWKPIWNQCTTKIILSSTASDTYTAKWVTERLGTATIEVETTQHAQNESPFFLGIRAKRLGEGQRDLMSIQEIVEMPIDDSLIILGNKPPIYAHKVPHVLHPYSKEKAESPLGPIPPINDPIGRAERAEREAELLEAWEHDPRNGADIYTEEQLDEMALAPGAVVKESLKVISKAAVNKLKKKGPASEDKDDDGIIEFVDILDDTDFADDEDARETTESTKNGKNTAEPPARIASPQDSAGEDTTDTLKSPAHEVPVVPTRNAAADIPPHAKESPGLDNNKAAPQKNGPKEAKAAMADGSTLIGSATILKPAAPDLPKKRASKVSGTPQQKQDARAVSKQPTTKSISNAPTPPQTKPSQNTSHSRGGSVVKVTSQMLSDNDLNTLAALYREGSGATAMKSNRLPG